MASLYLDTIDQKIIGSLKQRQMHPSELARALGISRTTLSYRLKRFSAHGIASEQPEGRKSVWRLVDSTLSADRSVLIYNGKDIETAYEQLLTLPRHSMIISVQCSGAARGELSTLSSSFIQKAHKIFREKKFILKGISNQSALKNFSGLNTDLVKSHVGRSVGLKLFSNDLFKGDGEIFVTDRFVLLTNPSKELAMICTDKAIIAMLKETLTLLYDQLENMRTFDISSYLQKLR